MDPNIPYLVAGWWRWMRGLTQLLWLGVIIASLHVKPIQCSLASKRLYEDLFTDYNRLILPVASNNTKVTVTLSLKLGQILDLNLKQQILSTNVWVEQTWFDQKLQWDPVQYEGIDMIHVPAENIWIPDIVLFNNADGNYELTLVAKARAYSNGTVVWRPPTMFRSTCEIDVQHFPFDIQTCFLRFGSWTYAGDELELRHPANKRRVENGVDLSEFYKNVEWDIIDVTAYHNEVYYECCTEPYPDMTFKIVIRRKMLFYLVNLILPVALMTFMTVSVFYLPSDSNEKVTLSISILTSLIVFFLLMLEIIPASSLAVPLFGKYLLFTMVLVSLSACVSVYVLNIHHRSPSAHSMSPKCRQIFLKTLPRLLRLDQPDPRERSSLNRFRKKKIAQQMLQTGVNKIYDLSQPLAASLNLIESLHRSYEYDANDDDTKSPHTKKSRAKSILEDDSEGRYFRRYVDNYIDRMKRVQESEEKSRIHQQQQQTQRVGVASQPPYCQHCLHSPQSGVILQPHLLATNQHHPVPVGAGLVCACRHNNHGHLANAHDDTLDMTFDYDVDREFGVGLNQTSELPSPPPPPRPVMQLSDSMRDLRAAKSPIGGAPSGPIRHSPSSVIGDIHLVDNLINSINMINTSDEIETTTSSSNDVNYCEDDDDDDDDDDGVEDDNEVDDDEGCAIGDDIDDDLEDNRGENLSQNTVIYSHWNQPSNMASQPADQVCSCRLATARNGPNLNYHQPKSYPQREQPYQRQQPRHQLDAGLLTNSTGMPSQVPLTPKQQQQANDFFPSHHMQKPSDLLLSLRLPYDQMPAHVRAAIRSILFIADTIKNEDDENATIEDWESMSMVVDRLFLWVFCLLCTFGSIIILASAPSLYDQRLSIDDLHRIDFFPSNCSM